MPSVPSYPALLQFKSILQNYIMAIMKLSYSQQISQGQTLNQDKLLSAPAMPIIYNNLHSLLILPKYHLLQNTAALLQMKTVGSICFEP